MTVTEIIESLCNTIAAQTATINELFKLLEQHIAAEELQSIRDAVAETTEGSI